MRKIDLNDFQVATSETARDINRRIVLNLVRKHQPVSRADLSRHSGLQRSTVSAITEQLLEQRWIVEGAVGQLPRGRKPTFLHINGERAGIVGVTIRPITTSVAVAGLDTNITAQESLPTENDQEEFLKQLCQCVCRMMKAHSRMTFEGIGVSLPGRVDPRTQRLAWAPNLMWRDLDIKRALEEATGLPVELENAANACALSEVWCGRHSDGTPNLAAVTISEGIGVGMILNGQLVKGASGMAGEFGHVSLDEKGPQCNCGNRGCWEVFAANPAAVRYYERSMPKSSDSENGRSRISFGSIMARARQGDVQASKALDQMAHYIGAGIAMVVSAVSPDVIVVVGEVTEAWSQVGPIVMEVVKKRVAPPSVPNILPTDPATQPRMRGTIAVILQKHFGAPNVA